MRVYTALWALAWVVGCNSAPGEPCATTVPCVDDAQCVAVAGTSCNTLTRRCQTVLCGLVGEACSLRDHCREGLVCRGACQEAAPDTGRPDVGADAAQGEDAPRIDPCPTDFSGTYDTVENPLNPRECGPPGRCTATRVPGGYRWQCADPFYSVTCAMDADCTCRDLDRGLTIDFPNRTYSSRPPLGLTCQGDF